MCCVRQERPEDVPTGELPRAMTLVADRHLVGRVAPGTRVTVTGIYSICQVCRPCHSPVFWATDTCTRHALRGSSTAQQRPHFVRQRVEAGGQGRAGTDACAGWP